MLIYSQISKLSMLTVYV
uniref:Uncharacterized protein n=1 Tax=Arundo donax TaxID=35708 RepID=A0A0A8Y1W7_ARUDO